MVGAGPITMPVVADELPYESSPAKVATILYVPISGGVQAMLKAPEGPSVVVVPTLITEHLLGQLLLMKHQLLFDYVRFHQSDAGCKRIPSVSIFKRIFNINTADNDTCLLNYKLAYRKRLFNS